MAENVRRNGNAEGCVFFFLSFLQVENQFYYHARCRQTRFAHMRDSMKVDIFISIIASAEASSHRGNEDKRSRCDRKFTGRISLEQFLVFGFVRLADTTLIQTFKHDDTMQNENVSVRHLLLNFLLLSMSI